MLNGSVKIKQNCQRNTTLVIYRFEQTTSNNRNENESNSTDHMVAVSNIFLPRSLPIFKTKLKPSKYDDTSKIHDLSMKISMDISKNSNKAIDHRRIVSAVFSAPQQVDDCVYITSRFQSSHPNLENVNDIPNDVTILDN